MNINISKELFEYNLFHEHNMELDQNYIDSGVDINGGDRNGFIYLERSIYCKI